MPQIEAKHVRVLAVDDSPAFLHTLCSFLEDDPIFEIVATAQSGQEALERRQTMLPPSGSDGPADAGDERSGSYGGASPAFPRSPSHHPDCARLTYFARGLQETWRLCIPNQEPVESASAGAPGQGPALPWKLALAHVESLEARRNPPLLFPSIYALALILSQG